MPTSAEEEAERLKKEAAAQQSEHHQAVIANILPSGTVKEQMQAQAKRPDPENTPPDLKDYERRKDADAERDKRFAAARDNNPPHPTIQHSELIAADNAKAVADTMKAEAAKREAEKAEAATKQTEQRKADERSKEEQPTEYAIAPPGTAALVAPGSFAQRRAQLDAKRAAQSQEQQQEAGVSFSRFAERRKADQSSQRFEGVREQSDFRQRQAARAEQRPEREATEARTSRANSSDGKQKDQDGAER